MGKEQNAQRDAKDEGGIRGGASIDHGDLFD